MCICIPSFTGPSCSVPITGFRPIFPSWKHTGVLEIFPVVMILLYAAHALFPTRSHGANRFLLQHFVVSWPAVASGRLHTLLTAPFLHTSVLHLLSNAASYIVYGPQVMAALGSGDFLAFIAFAAFMSSLGTLLFAAAFGKSRFMGWGASGLVAALRTLAALIWMGRGATLEGGIDGIRDHVVVHLIADILVCGSLDVGSHIGGAVSALLYQYFVRFKPTRISASSTSLALGKKAIGHALHRGMADSKKEKKGKAPVGEHPLEVSPRPDYIQHRITMFDELMKKYKADVAAKPREAIKITLNDGRVIDGTSWETTPMEIAKGIAKSLAERTVIAKVDGALWDLTRPFEKSGTLELLDFEHPEGRMVFWHSSAHVMGEACELHYGCHLCIGPPVEEGFYYEMAMERTVTQADYPALDTLAKKAVKEKQNFERLLVSKEDLLKMFAGNKYKVHIIKDKIPDGTSTTVYRCGPLIDLCYGPHVPDTGRIKEIRVVKNSASYFLGDAKNDSLQRIYGISFPDKKQMQEYMTFMEEAAKRDHRKIGIEQELFFFNELSPGSCFFLPNGARIYNALIDLQRNEYRKRGFEEVITPNMYNTKLWEISGHWQNYKEDMFFFDIEKEKFALKPMNCPGHCLIFKHRDRSWRDLPIRMADFGVLHRNEASGALTGLTRVRRFQQDDAHIFCTLDQVFTEMEGCLDFLQHIYGIFGFTFNIKLSTRPEKFLGDVATWDKAESLLEEALNKYKDLYGFKWELNPGDGAFYGPKLDITISDALRRRHQCATIQLDFQLPNQFKLEYVSDKIVTDETGKVGPEMKRPVMIHRAVLGSVERMFAILTESFAGKWPFWLSPFQVAIIPVSKTFNDYAAEVKKKLWDAGLYVEADTSDLTLNKKIRNAEIRHYNFIFVVGAEEQNTNTVNVRNRDDPETKSKGEQRPVNEILAQLLALKESKSRDQILGKAGSAPPAVSPGGAPPSVVKNASGGCKLSQCQCEAGII